MKRAMLLCLSWMTAAADGPPGLVGVSPAESSIKAIPAASSAAWFDYRIVMVLALVGVSLFLVHWAFKQRALRRNPATMGFVALCRRLGVNRSEQRTLESLSRTHGNATAASLLLCPSAFETAVSLVKGSAGDKFACNVERIRAKIV